MQANIHITLRESILDPKGKATHHALENLGFKNVKNVRIGKYIQMEIDTRDPEKALEIAREACEKLLANTVMENYEVEITDDGTS